MRFCELSVSLTICYLSRLQLGKSDNEHTISKEVGQPRRKQDTVKDAVKKGQDNEKIQPRQKKKR